MPMLIQRRKAARGKRPTGAADWEALLALPFKELRARAAAAGVYRVGMNKHNLVEALSS